MRAASTKRSTGKVACDLYHKYNDNKANRIGADETTGDYELGTLIKKCRYPQKFHEHH